MWKTLVLLFNLLKHFWFTFLLDVVWRKWKLYFFAQITLQRKLQNYDQVSLVTVLWTQPEYSKGLLQSCVTRMRLMWSCPLTRSPKLSRSLVMRNLLTSWWMMVHCTMGFHITFKEHFCLQINNMTSIFIDNFWNLFLHDRQLPKDYANYFFLSNMTNICRDICKKHEEVAS